MWLALSCMAAATAVAAPTSGDVSARVQHVLATTPLIDGHNDLPWAIRMRYGNVGAVDLAADLSKTTGTDTDAAKQPLMTDIPRLRAGRVGGQFWSVYVPVGESGPRTVEMTLEQIDIVRTMVAKYPDTFEMAYTADDIERIHDAGRIASLIGVEGGHQIDDSLAVLRAYFALGARYMTLTHWKNTAWADAATDKPEHHGLTAFGRAVVHEMNRLGMLVDLSHVSADTMCDAIDASAAPVMFSHSSARALVDHPRDVPDDVLRMVKQNHGIVMVNFYPGFISQRVVDWNADRAGARARFEALYIDQPQRVEAALARWDDQHPRPEATLAEVADHIEHIRKIAGVASVGIGSDFDGIGSTPIGLGDVSRYPALFEELARRGWSDDELAALAGRNLLRVMREAERVAARLQASEGPSFATLAIDKPGE